jgi:hypothetical protein
VTGDPILDWWEGRMKCPHKETVSGLAKDCLPCLREIIGEFAEYSRHWQKAAIALGHLEKAKGLQIEALKKDFAAIIETAYEVARGTKNLSNPGFTRSQPYWKGRSDAANDVRALKEKMMRENR